MVLDPFPLFTLLLFYKPAFLLFVWLICHLAYVQYTNIPFILSQGNTYSQALFSFLSTIHKFPNFPPSLDRIQTQDPKIAKFLHKPLDHAALTIKKKCDTNVVAIK